MAERATRSLICACLLFLAAGCGRTEASPEAMREAAAFCGIATWAVAASGDATQSRYALHYDSAEAGIEPKLGCFEQKLRSAGMEPTLTLGSAGFDPRTDDALLFARVKGECNLPPSAVITQQDGALILYGASDLPQQMRDCASHRLGEARRFRKVEFSHDPPPPPRVKF